MNMMLCERGSKCWLLLISRVVFVMVCVEVMQQIVVVMFLGVLLWFSGVIVCVLLNCFLVWLFDIMVSLGVMLIICILGVSVCVSSVVVLCRVVLERVQDRKLGLGLYSFWFSRLMMIVCWFFGVVLNKVWVSSMGVLMLVFMWCSRWLLLKLVVLL